MDIKELSKLVSLDLKEQLDDVVEKINVSYREGSSLSTEEIKKTLHEELEKQRDLYFKQLKEYFDTTQKQLDGIYDRINKRLDEMYLTTKETNEIIKMDIIKNKGVIALYDLTNKAKKILKLKKSS